MSKLGYIQQSYGKQFNIALSNTYSYNVLGGNNLPSNTLIISSPVDENNDDIGSYSILATDYLGTAVRLTYTIKEGNGIIYNDDSLGINIDNNTIIENDNNELSANIYSIIDNDTIKYDDSYIYIDTDNLDKISTSKRGLFKIDERTIKSDEGKIYVDTQNLNYANSNINSGIVIGDGITVKSDNGVLSVISENINKSDSENFGVVLTDNNTIINDEGVISVNTQNLNKCSSYNYGVIKVDNSSIIIDNDSNISVDTNNLSKVSNTSKGVFKYDPHTFEIVDDKLSVKNNSYFLEKIDIIKNKISYVQSKIDQISDKLHEYKIGIIEPMILDFHCVDIPSATFRKPNYLDEPIYEMEFQYISVNLLVSTNCPFIISIKFEDNIDPQISLYEINYNDININYGNEGLLETYQSTNGEKVPIKLTFIGKNYYNNDVSNFSNKVKVKIIVSYVNDVEKYREVNFSMIRFNSGYNENITYPDHNLDI